MMDYKEKYLKYKSKYLSLKHQRMIGGSRRMTGNDWDKKFAVQKKYLDTISNTKSFIAKDKIGIRSKTYIIRDNGGEPFKITINKDEILIQKATNHSSEIQYAKPFKRITKFKGYYPGFDPSLYEENGNSILIKVTNNKYIHVGYIIYSFKASDEITDFLAWMGQNGIPYPLAFGTQNVYFLLENVYVPNDKLETPLTIANGEKLYQEMYPNMKKISLPVMEYKLISARNEDY